MKQIKSNIMANSLSTVVKVHFFLILAYIVQIIAYDASKLITPDVVLKRWFVAAGLGIIVALIWYLDRSNKNKLYNSYLLTWVLIIADIIFASFNVYTQRGMASRAVVLFFIPIMVSSILLSRLALFTTAIICIAVYTSTAVAYFVNFFNEGYKIELYGEILFYSATFLIAAGLLWAVLKQFQLKK